VRKFFKITTVLAWNLALALVLAEIVALGAYFYETGSLYYTDPPRGREAALDLEGSVEGYRIHPYYGYSFRPGVVEEEGSEVASNNFGFESRLDYPVDRVHSEQLLVGIFGGSVAAQFAAFEAREGILARRLAAARGISAGDVVVLNFGQGGYKQPQQLQVLTHLRSIGQELDLAINVDGFNEIALGGRNLEAGIALDMPSHDHVRALQDVTGIADSPESLERMLRMRVSWARHAEVFNRAWGGEAWELRLASGFLFDWLRYKYHLRQYEQARADYAASEAGSAETSWLFLAENRLEVAPASPEAMAEAIELWERSSRLMYELERANGGCYLHFVQANQYHDTGRVFSAEERRVAFTRGSSYAPYVRAGYPGLEEATERLAAEGLPVHGLFHLFDEVSEPAYVDACCHYTDLGQRLLADTVAEAAVVALNPASGACT